LETIPNGGNVARPRVQYLSDDDKRFVHGQVVRVLEEVGVAYNTPSLTEVLGDAGASVDRENLTAKIPWALVERCLAHLPKTVLLAGRDPAFDCVVGGDRLLYTSDGAATYVLDDLTGRRHEGTEADLARFMRLYDAVPEIDFTWATITPGDVDPRVGNLEMARIAFENSRKHLQDEVRIPGQAPVMIELLETIAGAPLSERPIWSATNCTIAPLQHDGEMTEAHILMARAGCPIFILPMPQMGTTGPMSVLGTSILNMAELLSAVVLFQLAAPGCAMISAVGSAVAEMRSGLYLSGAPEDGLINMMCIEMSKHYGMLTQGSAVSCDAKACDLQAGAEGMLTGIATALAGADVMLAFGLMDSAQTASIAKTVLDADTVKAIERFLRDDPIDEASSLVDDIVEVGIGGHFLARKSTRQRYRAGELWQAKHWHRGTFDQYADNSLVQDAWDTARRLIAESDALPLPDDVIRHVRQLIAGCCTESDERRPGGARVAASDSMR
jgi:trimethylamine---corrinoid protein Co-methyltransferase